MLQALWLMGGLGLVVGAGLALASKIFYVYVDPLILAVEDALPGANCGGCGLPGCGANAEAIVAGITAPDSCVAAGPETAEAIASIMGVTIEAKEPDVSKPNCTYGVNRADIKYIYNGLQDCRAASFLSGGMKVCDVGCLGLGSCIKACKFNAISMSKEGLPVVDEKKCTGCGACEKACPKNIINLTSVTRRILLEYTTKQCITPCQRACPAGINICEYIRQINLGNYDKALQVIKERNPFPAIIGRICPRPCENACRRGLIDESVAINFLKRFVADYEIEQGKKVLPYKAPATEKKIAVIGAGVEGLSCAFFLARLGHSPTIFEATDQVGGLLRTAIVKNRLPLEILESDIQGITEIGVDIITNKILGNDFTIDSLLQEGFEAVFLAAGGWDSKILRKNEEKPIPGVFLLVDIMKSDIKIGKNVVISGIASPEAITRCKKLGAEKIVVLTDKIEQKEKNSDQNILYKTSVTGIIGKGEQLIKVNYLENSSTRSIEADSLIIAAGRFPEFIFTLTSDEWEGNMPYSGALFDFERSMTDYSSAVRAIGAGRKAAASVHKIMYKIENKLPEDIITEKSVLQDVVVIKNIEPTMPRQIMPLEPENQAEKGFTEDMALAEAKRCLECGLICYRKGEA